MSMIDIDNDELTWPDLRLISGRNAKADYKDLLIRTFFKGVLSTDPRKLSGNLMGFLQKRSRLREQGNIAKKWHVHNELLTEKSRSISANFRPGFSLVPIRRVDVDSKNLPNVSALDGEKP